MDFQKDEAIVNSLIEETREHLSEMENGILLLEKNRENADNELIHSMFRAAHSIKSGANLLKLETIETLSHTFENLLLKLRQRQLDLNKEMVETFLTGIDDTGTLLNNLETPSK